MKVFFTASQRGKAYFDSYYKKIFDTLSHLDLENIDSEIVKINSKVFYEELEKEGRKRYIELYKNSMQNIKKADVNIFECSLPSLSVGFMIEKSLEINKPTVALYLKDNIPFFLEGINEEKLIVKSYNDSTLETVISEAIEEAKNQSDKRFNFFINPSLLLYLEEASKKNGVTKSTFIRNLILDHMRNR